jgi:lipopolysaccharide/colanic/teichoic acid biosynthesis glycosyltransferase/capsular polysaccharide biosynthesis protein
LAVLKRVLDIAVAAIGLVLLSPLMLVITILIKLDSRGPVFYRAPRVGKDGQEFRMFKFRTMVTDAEKIGPAITVDKDPRITRVGVHLRKVRLDEIPQLLNVLRGEMSMVGPRPEAPYYVDMYSPEQREVLAAKPGMTGPAQIAFRHEEEDLSDPETLDEQYMNVILPPKLTMDLEYIEQHSVVTDLKILFRTAWVLLTDRLRALFRAAGTRLSSVVSGAGLAWKRMIADHLRALLRTVVTRVSTAASRAGLAWKRTIANRLRTRSGTVVTRVSTTTASGAGLPWRGMSMELRDIMNALTRRFWLLIAGTGLAVIGSYLALRLLTPWPRYEASATAILGNSNLNSDWGALQANRELATTYVEWATRRPVLEGVIEALSLPISAEELREQIDARLVGNTQMIEVSVTSPGRHEAAAIANEVMRQLEIQISDAYAETYIRDALEEGVQPSSTEKIAELEARISDTESKLSVLTNLLLAADSTDEAELLTQRINVLQTNLDIWQREYDGLRADNAGRPSVRMIMVEHALPPTQAASPLLNVLVAGVAGLAATAGVVLLLETRYRSDNGHASLAWLGSVLEVEDRPVTASTEGDIDRV